MCANLQFALPSRQFALLLAALLQLALELLAVSFTGHQRMLHIVNKLLERCLRLQMHNRYQTPSIMCGREARQTIFQASAWVML